MKCCQDWAHFFWPDLELVMSCKCNIQQELLQILQQELLQIPHKKFDASVYEL